VNRDDFQKLAIERLADAKALLTLKRWAGAYYLAGYAVECGLKSCVIADLMKTDLFPAKRFSEQCWTHDLEQLLSLAGLEAELNNAMNADADLRKNWDTINDWSEASRYVRKTKVDAEELYEAIADRKHGVLSWIKARW
jgi:HEPN domain-containing protein